MPKLPRAPDRAWLKALKPALTTLPAGQPLARVYFRAGRHPVRWSDLRYFGPVRSARFDHHEPASDESGQLQSRGILYCALADDTSLAGLDTCLAEVFQATRTVSLTIDSPAWAVFALTAEVTLLDLCGRWPTKAGASQALSTGPKSSARRWAHAFHEIYPQIQGLIHPSAMAGGRYAVALNERALHAIPAAPQIHYGLGDRKIDRVVRKAAGSIGFCVVP